jgi:chemotaxis protein methyltransferase CheR
LTTHLRDAQLLKLSDFVAANLGLHYPRGRWGDLERQTNSAAKEFGLADAGTLLQQLLSSPVTRHQIEMLAAHLTNTETYFWREPHSFEALRDSILPEVLRARQTGDLSLRVWCAGCSTGEEAYSIAILLRELIPVLEDWRITLLATDINPHILRRAALGVYGEWSFRNAPRRLKQKYFYFRNAGKFEIRPEIRKMVSFAPLNLAEDIYPSLITNTNAMDIIFCRNVLMYFAKDRGREVVQRFYRALAEGGWLIVAATELSPQLFPQFALKQFPGAFAYRREALRGGLPAGLPVQPAAKQILSPQPPASGAAVPAPPRPRDRQEQGSAVETGRTETAAELALALRRLANQGKLREALAASENAIAANRLDANLHYLHAVILSEEKLDGEAVAALKRALYLDPNFVLAHFALGNLAQRQGKAQDAKKSFINTLALLDGFGPDDILPEAEGLTAGRLREIARSSLRLGELKQ